MGSNRTDDRLRKLLRAKDASTKPKPRKKVGAEVEDIDISKIEEMSESELVELAHAVGYETATRQLLREELIDLILGGRQTIPEDPVQSIRERTWAYVEKNTRIMRSQMPCDLDCLNCPSRTVLVCYTVNHDYVD